MAYDELPPGTADRPAPQQRRWIPLPDFLKSRVGRIVVAVASPAVLLPVLASPGRYNDVELVQPIGLGLEAMAVVVGIVVGVLLAEAWTVAWQQGHMMFMSRLSLGSGVTRTGHNVRSDERASRSLRGWPLMLLLVIGSVLTATKLARAAVMWGAFAGVTTTAAPERFTIVGKIHGGRRTRSHLDVRLATGGRTFGLRVSAEALASARAGMTLLLPVETGRGGVQRVAPPAAPIERVDLHLEPYGSVGAAPGG